MIDKVFNMFNVRTNKPEAIVPLEEHLAAEFGPSEFIIHDARPTLPHIDIHVFGPTDERPWYALVTSGMSDQVMHVPDSDGKDEDCYLELILCLPQLWRFNNDTFQDPDWMWPVTLLQNIARYPFAADTYLWLGHTIPNFEPYGPWTDLCNAIIFPPVFSSLEALRIAPSKTINFMQLFLIHEDELQYKLQFGKEALWELFADTYEGRFVPEIMFDITRQSVLQLD